MADRAAVIAKIREHYAALDIPLDKLSDIDVEMGVRHPVGGEFLNFVSPVPRAWSA